MNYHYEALNRLRDSLAATGVLSKEYASLVVRHALAAATEAHAAGKAEVEGRLPTMKVAEMDELDWAFIYAAVSDPTHVLNSAQFGEDANVVRQRVFSRLQPVVQAMSLPSPLTLRLYLLEPHYAAAVGERYGPLPRTCGHRGGEGYMTMCGLPLGHREVEHSWESRLCLWRCENGHVIEQPLGEPSKCKGMIATRGAGVGMDGGIPCPAKFFLPLSACARRSWLDARDPMSAGKTTELPAVDHRKGAQD